MRRIPKRKLRIMTIMFLGTGVWGIVLGMILPGFQMQPASFPLYMTIMGVSQLGLAGFMGWKYFTQPEETDGKKRRRKHR